MKKAKIITAAVLAATLLMGAGYASWTSSVNINHNITTGTMDVQFIDKTSLVAGSKYVQPQVKVDDAKHNVTFTLDNLYPGAQYSTLTAEKNAGSIGVTFDKAKITFAEGSNEALKSNMVVDFTCWVYDKQGKHKDSIKFENKAGVALTDLDKELSKVLAGVTLEPGEYLELRGNDYTGQLMTFTLKDGDNLDNSTQNKSLSFSIQLDWKQFNK